MASSSLAQQKRDATRRKAEIESDYKLGTARQKADYGVTKGALDRALSQNLTETRGDFSGRGLYNSSIRQGEEADLATEYARDAGAASQALQRELENLGRAKTKGTLGIATGMESGLFQSTGESLSSILARALNDARNKNRMM